MILLAGSTGYLGHYILKELQHKEADLRLIVRDKKKLPQQVLEKSTIDIITAELTNPKAIENSCQGVDTVISTVGITKQKEGLTYMAVDYQANLNLLEEAQRCGVKKFIYISVFNGDKLTHLKIGQAKEKFVNALKQSHLDYCIIRPTGYFSDMYNFYSMAQKGRCFVLGNGKTKMNPIHGIDLAKECVNAIHSEEVEIAIGGPNIYTYNKIAQMALSAAGKKAKITTIPLWISNSILFLLRTFTGSKTYGPIEFMLTVLSMDMIAPTYGNHTLKDYFEKQDMKKQT